MTVGARRGIRVASILASRKLLVVLPFKISVTLVRNCEMIVGHSGVKSCGECDDMICFSDS